MKKTILALTLALGMSAGLAAIASAAPLTNENPNNCSPALRDCASSGDGSNHVVRHFAEPRQTALPNQQTEAPSPENPAGVATGTPDSR